MRLISLYVEEYRVLEKLAIDFGSSQSEVTKSLQPGYCLDFLVGLNGSGKSTVLHLLSRIFKNILLDEGTFSETVELKYNINGNIVTVSNRLVNQPESDSADELSNGRSFRFEVQYADGTNVEGQTRIPIDLLPAQVIVYTTGNETAWLRQLYDDNSDELAEELSISGDEIRRLHELPGHQHIDTEDNQEDDITPPIMFIPSQRLPLITLCGLIASRKYNANNEILQPVLNSMNIEKLVGFSIRLRLDPEWTKGTQPDVVNKLEETANHQTQQGADRLFVFNFDQDVTELRQILDLYSTPIEIFQRLNRLCESNHYQNSPLKEVNLFFRSKPSEASASNIAVTNEQSLYLYDWLSDGEQSFLGRMALFSLFRADNLLIMLDEPEVHFNDSWKREIVNMLHGIMDQQSSHALITTHSSIALTDVPKESIVVLRREGSTTGGEKGATSPGINTLGADPSDVLVHVFGTGSATGRRSVSYIGSRILDGNLEDLENLEKIVAPGYWRYRIELEKQRIQPQ